MDTSKITASSADGVDESHLRICQALTLISRLVPKDSKITLVIRSPNPEKTEILNDGDDYETVAEALRFMGTVKRRIISTEVSKR